MAGPSNRGRHDQGADAQRPAGVADRASRPGLGAWPPATSRQSRPSATNEAGSRARMRRRGTSPQFIGRMPGRALTAAPPPTLVRLDAGRPATRCGRASCGSRLDVELGKTLRRWYSTVFSELMNKLRGRSPCWCVPGTRAEEIWASCGLGARRALSTVRLRATFPLFASSSNAGARSRERLIPNLGEELFPPSAAPGARVPRRVPAPVSPPSATSPVTAAARGARGSTRKVASARAAGSPAR